MPPRPRWRRLRRREGVSGNWLEGGTGSGGVKGRGWGVGVGASGRGRDIVRGSKKDWVEKRGDDDGRGRTNDLRGREGGTDMVTDAWERGKSGAGRRGGGREAC